MCDDRALKCALAVRNHCTHELTSHIALSCGNMTISALGGFNGQYIFLLNGSPIPELKSCIEAAKSKDVIITEKVWNILINCRQLKFTACFMVCVAVFRDNERFDA